MSPVARWRVFVWVRKARGAFVKVVFRISRTVGERGGCRAARCVSVVMKFALFHHVEFQRPVGWSYQVCRTAKARVAAWVKFSGWGEGWRDGGMECGFGRC
jgi:hypothetical protein